LKRAERSFVAPLAGMHQDSRTLLFFLGDEFAPSSLFIGFSPGDKIAHIIEIGRTFLIVDYRESLCRASEGFRSSG
jgi:hypothetical protein